MVVTESDQVDQLPYEEAKVDSMQMRSDDYDEYAGIVSDANTEEPQIYVFWL